ncbi:MAG TPA: aminotransferase class V-fold PLP-dependent enzyme [Thermomicrobiales bacterium]
MAVAVDAKVDQIRQEMPATLNTVYLNTGTCGPLPRRTVTAMQETMMEELEQGRIAPNHYPGLMAARTAAKNAVADVLGCTPNDVAIAGRTTDGMNIAIAGYPWQRGDEIITSNIEHPGGLMPTFLTKRRYGTRVRVANIGVGEMKKGDTVREFERLVTPHTRMIVISHISYTTGAVLPVKEIAAMAHSHDILMAVDAAQSFGSLPLNMDDLGADFYACPGQKWICGPEGTGSLYVRPSSIGEIDQTFGGGMERGSLDYYGASFAPAAGAGRFDVGSYNLSLLVGQKASTEYIRDEVGLDWAYARIKRLGEYAHKLLSGMKGITVVTPEEHLAGLVAFTVNGIGPTDLKNRLLAEHNVTIRDVNKYINNPDALRLATGFYNTEEDLDRMADGIKAVQKSL